MADNVRRYRLCSIIPLFLEQKLVNTIATTTFLFNHVHTRNHFALGFRVIPVAKRYGFDMRIDLTEHARTVNTTDFAQFRQVVFI